MTEERTLHRYKELIFPRYGWFGLVLIAIFWALNWFLTGPRTSWAFFPLWLGYCLVIDALVAMRKGSSLFTRNRFAYIGLFFVSAPAWWLFEFLNLRAGNWLYLGRDIFSDTQYAVMATFSFSTVIPAVFGTAELMSTTSWLKAPKRGLIIPNTLPASLAFFFIGWLTLGLFWLFPRYFFPFLWISIFFIIEPINIWLGHRSLGSYVAHGNWRPVLALWSGVLICGFFWEMWNFYSFPKWQYRVPFVDFLHIFEMPLLGYGGYLPFSLELFSLYHLLLGFLGRKQWPYVEIESD